METTDLTRKVLEHQKTGSGQAELMTEIVREVIDNREAYGMVSKDEACDILASYYPRISSLVKRFNGEGRCFEPFLYSSLKFHRKSLACREREDALRERELRNRRYYPDEDIECPEVPAQGAARRRRGASKSLIDALTLAPANSVSRSSARKRLLYLGMKCAFSLGERHIAALAEAAGLPEDHLSQRISFLRSMAETRLARKECLALLRDKLFASVCVYERKCHDELDEVKRERYASMLRRYRSRLERCRERLVATRSEPTNAEIALALGVPKGTVDSGIYCFKHFNTRLP